jgi:hypothetical protein
MSCHIENSQAANGQTAGGAEDSAAISEPDDQKKDDATQEPVEDVPEPISSKPWWAIILVSVLTGVGLQIASTIFTVGKDTIVDVFDKSVTLQVYVLYENSQLPLAGAAIKIKDAKGENLIKNDITNQSGLAVFDKSIHYGSYVIETGVKDKGVSYALTDPQPLDKPFLRFAYAFSEKWPRVLNIGADAEASISSSFLEPAPVPASTKGPVWLATAFSQLGTKAESDQGTNSQILEYWKSIPGFNGSQSSPLFWPSAFVAWKPACQGILEWLNTPVRARRSRVRAALQIREHRGAEADSQRLYSAHSMIRSSCCRQSWFRTMRWRGSSASRLMSGRSAGSRRRAH